MAILKIYVVFLTLIVSALTCDLKSTQEESDAKAALEAYITNKKNDINPRYRLHYHVMPPVGWMNDPNGFAYFKGQYHLFYQFYPYNATNGPMHWGHATSPNLVEWTQRSTALLPGAEGQIFSGSAIEKDGTFVLIYTGHKNAANNISKDYEAQYLAFSNDGEVFHKYKKSPILAPAPGGSPDFRDPKVWKYGNYWYMVLGSKNDNNYGTVLLYRSSDMGSWELKSVLGESKGSLGYMWECPDFFYLNGKYILLMSPQGLSPQGDKYNNVYQTGYFIGNFDYQSYKFTYDESSFQEIDYGHDFYATQTTEKDGKRYLSAWFSMWEVPHPEAEDGWAGTMTIFRELTLRENRILMKPVEAMTTLREFPAVHNGNFAQNAIIEFNQTGELIVTGDLSKNITLNLKGKDDNATVITLHWNVSTRKVVVDRAGDIRQRAWTPISSVQSWRIFLDASSVELFCGEGEAVFSSRAFPSGDWRVTNLSPQNLIVTAYKLKRSVPK